MRPRRGWPWRLSNHVGTEGGGTFTFDEFVHDLKAAGFTDIELVHQGNAMDSLIRARKP